MALRPTSAPAFESEDETVAPAATPEAVQQPTAVAVQGTRAVATAASVAKQNVLSMMKDAFRVEYDSLPRLTASQGSFVFKDTEEDLGSQIQVALLSYQDSWVCSPNDKKADIELVKYADNSVTARDGTDLLAHLQMLKEQGYTKASIAHRCVIVGELISTSGKSASNRVGELVQLDLPETGRKNFNTYQIQASYAVAKGRKTAEEAALLTMQFVKAKSSAGETFFKIVFA